MKKTVLQSNSLKDLFLDDAFCMKLAKHLHPDAFMADEYRFNTWYGRIVCKNHFADKLFRCPVPKEYGYDANLYIEHYYEKAYIEDGKSAVINEFSTEPSFKKRETGPLQVIARKKISTTRDLFLKVLSRYQANTLLVQEIEIDNLTLEEIRALTAKKFYTRVFFEEMGG